MIDDPENFAQAYTWDLKTGYYLGMIRRQPDPKNPGSFLLPAFSTAKRPPFMEGMRPKWNGHDWELVPKSQAVMKEKKVRATYDEAKQIFTDEFHAVAKSLIQAEIQKQSNELRELILKQLTAHSNNLSEVLQGELRAFVKNKVDSELGRIEDRMGVVMGQIVLIESRAHDVHSQTLNAANDVLTNVSELRKAVAADKADVKKWWQIWKSTSPALNAPETNETGQSGV